MSSCAAQHLFDLDRVQQVAETIASEGKAGRVLTNFAEKKMERLLAEGRDLLERFLGLLFSFDPEQIDEEGYEKVDHAILMVLGVLRDRKEDPFYSEAFDKVTEARGLIGRGYSPGRPPSEQELRAITENQASRLLEVLSE